MSTPYWHYFLSLERDFIRTLDFVELSPANTDTFSDNFAKLLLAAGSEVDVACKALCGEIAPGRKVKNILDYQSVVCSRFPNIHQAKILVDRNKQEVEPWFDWGAIPPTPPSWWNAYNKVKHNRVVNFERATQNNALLALAGLLVINRYYHHMAGLPQPGRHPSPYPVLLDAGTPPMLSIDSDRSLPGI